MQRENIFTVAVDGEFLAIDTALVGNYRFGKRVVPVEDGRATFLQLCLTIDRITRRFSLSG